MKSHYHEDPTVPICLACPVSFGCCGTRDPRCPLHKLPDEAQEIARQITRRDLDRAVKTTCISIDDTRAKVI